MYLRGKDWYSDFQKNGKRFVTNLGPIGKSEAKEMDRELRTKAKKGLLVCSENNPPFDHAIDEYLKNSEIKNQESTVKRNHHSAKYLKEFFKDAKIGDIENNKSIMLAYQKKRKKQIKRKQMEEGGRSESECSFSSINRELALMRKMFNELIKEQKAINNPIRFVDFFEEVPKERILTPEEQEAILNTIDQLDKRYHHMKDIILIGLNTAMRIGEILGMEKDWIFLEENIIRVPRNAQKRKKKDKRVPISSLILPIIKRRLNQYPESEYLIVNPNTGTRYTRIQNSWDHILKKSGLTGKPWVDKLRIHDLRHTAASNLARYGMNVKHIAEYLGHADTKTTMRYIHATDSDLHKGAEILARVTSSENIEKNKKSNESTTKPILRIASSS